MPLYQHCCCLVIIGTVGDQWIASSASVVLLVRHFLLLADLKDAFRTCGTVVYANVTRGDDGESRGTGIRRDRQAVKGWEAAKQMQ